MATGNIDSTMGFRVHILFTLVGEWPHILIENDDVGTEKVCAIE